MPLKLPGVGEGGERGGAAGRGEGEGRRGGGCALTRALFTADLA
jgi:hypothetical protein